MLGRSNNFIIGGTMACMPLRLGNGSPIDTANILTVLGAMLANFDVPER